MARKRASLKDKGEEILGVKRGGQGSDILFGTGAEAEAAAGPETDGTAPAVALPVVEGMPRGEADLDEAMDLDSLLSAEAEAAEGEATLPELATTPAAPVAPPAEHVAPPLAPAPPPAVERPVPAPPPPAMERPAPAPLPSAKPAAAPLPRPSAQPAAAPPPAVVRPAPAPTPSPAPAVAPPSTATGAPDLSAPREPRYVSMVAEDFDLLAEEASADAIAAAAVGAPEAIRLTAEQRARLLRRSSVQKKLVELDRAIEGQFDRILQENVSVNKSITDWCHNMLAEARAIVLNQQVEKLARAEWDVEQVRARLDRAEESRKQANRYAWPISVWGVVWFGIFVYLVFNPTIILQFLGGLTAGDTFLVPEIFLRSLFFGGIGGVAAVFYHVFKYAQNRSFDSQYVLSYFGKPFMGMILGSIVYLTIFVLMRVLRVAPVGLQEGGAEGMAEVMYTAILFVFALAAGFKENLAFALLGRIVKSVLGTEEEETVAAPPAAG